MNLLNFISQNFIFWSLLYLSDIPLFLIAPLKILSHEKPIPPPPKEGTGVHVILLILNFHFDWIFAFLHSASSLGWLVFYSLSLLSIQLICDGFYLKLHLLMMVHGFVWCSMLHLKIHEVECDQMLSLDRPQLIRSFTQLGPNWLQLQLRSMISDQWSICCLISDFRKHFISFR